MLDLTVEQVRAYARIGLIDPQRGARGEYRFSFQDLAFMRAAQGLLSSKIPRRRVLDALIGLRRRLPRNEHLSGMQLQAAGEQIFARQGATAWNLETGQGLLDFDGTGVQRKVSRHASRTAAMAEAAEEDLDAGDWFELGEDLERAAPDHARDAYRHALELDPGHLAAHHNLGRLLQNSGRLEAAELHYRMVITHESHNAAALFNLGVCLEELRRPLEAKHSYRAAIAADPDCAEAHYNLSALLEKSGEHEAALEHIARYRELVRRR